MPSHRPRESCPVSRCLLALDTRLIKKKKKSRLPRVAGPQIRIVGTQSQSAPTRPSLSAPATYLHLPFIVVDKGTTNGRFHDSHSSLYRDVDEECAVAGCGCCGEGFVLLRRRAADGIVASIDEIAKPSAGLETHHPKRTTPRSRTWKPKSTKNRAAKTMRIVAISVISHHSPIPDTDVRQKIRTDTSRDTDEDAREDNMHIGFRVCPRDSRPDRRFQC